MSGVLRNLIVDGSNSTSTSEFSSTSRRRKRKPGEEFPIFVIWSNKSEDIFWKDFFLHASQGVLPDKFYISGNQLVCSIGKRKAITIRQDNRQEVINFIQNTGVTLGLREVDQLKEKATLTWIILRRRPTVLHIKIDEWLDKKYNLTKYEKKNAYNLIALGVSSNIIDVETVVMKDDNIVEIKNLIFDEKERKFRLTNNPKFKYEYKSSKVGKNKDPLCKIWERYCETVESFASNEPKMNHFRAEISDS